MTDLFICHDFVHSYLLESCKKSFFLIRLSFSGNKSVACFLNCFFKLFIRDIFINYSHSFALCMGRAYLFTLKFCLKVSFICDSHIPHIIPSIFTVIFSISDPPMLNRLEFANHAYCNTAYSFFQVNNVNFNLPFVCCFPQEDNSSRSKAFVTGQHNRCEGFQILLSRPKVCLSQPPHTLRYPHMQASCIHTCRP